MCGRYFIDNEEQNAEIRQIIETLTNKTSASRMLDIKTSGEVFLGDTVPVLAGNKIVPMTWGFSQNHSRGVINARYESAGIRTMFKKSFNEMRCLIPASGYYEWAKNEFGTQKLAFTHTNGDAIYMAGIYRFDRGEKYPSFVILTRPASQFISHIHSRMPVILPGKSRREWLNGGDAKKVLHEAVRFLRYNAMWTGQQSSV